MDGYFHPGAIINSAGVSCTRLWNTCAHSSWICHLWNCWVKRFAYVQVSVVCSGKHFWSSHTIYLPTAICERSLFKNIWWCHFYSCQVGVWCTLTGLGPTFLAWRRVEYLLMCSLDTRLVSSACACSGLLYIFKISCLSFPYFFQESFLHSGYKSFVNRYVIADNFSWVAWIFAFFVEQSS